MNDNSKWIVWRNALRRVFERENSLNRLCRTVEEAIKLFDKEFNYEELGKFNWNGRLIQFSN